VMLGSGTRARRTPTTAAHRSQNSRLFRTFQLAAGPGLRDFFTRCRKSRSASSAPIGPSFGPRYFERRNDAVPNDTPDFTESHANSKVTRGRASAIMSG
jgi:hypothetical protein